MGENGGCIDGPETGGTVVVMIGILVRSVVIGSVLVTGTVNALDNPERDGHIAAGVVSVHVDGYEVPNIFAPGVNEATPLNRIRNVAVGTWPGQLVWGTRENVLPRKSERAGLYQLAATTAKRDVPLREASTPSTATGASSDLAATLALLMFDKGGPSQPVAATGVVTPEGLVIPVDGVAAKIWAAHHAGAKHFILSEHDLPEVVDVPDGMTLHPVKKVRKAYRIVRDL